MLARLEVLLVGYFSAKDKDHPAAMDALAALMETQGARVVGRFVQRRGVSHGGAARMDQPLSRRTLISAGKAREVAQARASTGADAVVFVNALTAHQRAVLAEQFGCPVLSGHDLDGPAR